MMVGLLFGAGPVLVHQRAAWRGRKAVQAEGGVEGQAARTERPRHVVVDDGPGARSAHLEAGERERAGKGAHVVGAELVEDASGGRRGEASELG